MGEQGVKAKVSKIEKSKIDEFEMREIGKLESVHETINKKETMGIYLFLGRQQEGTWKPKGYEGACMVRLVVLICHLSASLSACFPSLSFLLLVVPCIVHFSL